VETLREFRRQKGWSQKDLADESGVGQDTISGIEKGRHEPRPSTLRKLADALEVEVADFFREPAVPLGEAPRGAGQAYTRTTEEFDRTLARVLEPVREEALREQQATSRVFASEGIPQMSIGDISEAETGDRFIQEFSPEERPIAFGDLALGYARLERAKENLEANYTYARELLRERNEKIAQLEAELERLEQAEAERDREAAR
jgi:transcriptional regulator with XRE-family HTH domain